MTIVSSFLEFNKQFVEQKQYEEYLTDKYPDKKIAILTCMDTRLVELLPKALNLRNGDAKIIKNAGAILTQPFGSAMRSILIAIYEMGAQEVLVIGHTNCGMTNLDTGKMVDKFRAGGISDAVLSTLENSGIRMERFLRGFNSPEEGVAHSVKIIRNHPLIPAHVPVHGFIMDAETGALEMIIDGYENV
ncbi:carbonic anhydrase [Paenibacillus sp. WQ 127069]|jgi:carbonic anhydrase|uniref:carbonic anhydrase n=1 Tax=Paenibacillus baimaensis TaxID=2982185 RepID=A0ABT2UN42_9BACL|nr:carbonic anhydrase [Paenibacillus sp. WQ 127069]MCU6795501.1 carbonic anhydrase [Paenibacillus sp. WQ 127069]